MNMDVNMGTELGRLLESYLRSCQTRVAFFLSFYFPSLFDD